MKRSIMAAMAAALSGGAVAGNLHHRQVHPHLQNRAYHSEEACVCVTVASTVLGKPTLIGAKPIYETPVPIPSENSTTVEGAVSVPTPAVTICSIPGTYTITSVDTDVAEENIVVTSVIQATVEVPCPSHAGGDQTHTSETVVDYTTTVEEAVPKPSDDKTPSPGGDHYAMTYTPYSNDGLCKSESEIQKDIATIAGAGFAAIRVYSTDCNTLEWVGSACASHGIKMILGIFVGAAGCGNSNPSVPEQIEAIASWAKWDLVAAIIVGNEAIFNGFCTASQVASLIEQCKTKFSGYSGPYSTAETLNVWKDSSTQEVLCGSIDFTGANIHPYFNADVTPSGAGDFTAGQLAIVDTVCPGKQALNLECGWPSAGNTNGKATTGHEAQKIAITAIRNAVGSRTVFFSFHDDMWKAPGSCQCEQSWGIGSLF